MDEDFAEEAGGEGKGEGRGGGGGEEEEDDEGWDWGDVFDGVGLEDLDGDFGWEDAVGALL